MNDAKCGAESGTSQRQLKPRQKAQVRKTKEAKGVKKAIAVARIVARGQNIDPS